MIGGKTGAGGVLLFRCGDVVGEAARVLPPWLVGWVGKRGATGCVGVGWGGVVGGGVGWCGGGGGKRGL